MKIRTPYLPLMMGAALFATDVAAPDAHAETDLLVCAFDDPAGASLAEAKVTAGDLSWSAAFADSTTDGNGALRVRRPSDGPYNAYLNLESFRPEDGVLYVEAVIAGYRFAGEGADERVRIGLTRNDHRSSPQVVAQFVLSRSAKDSVELSLSALGEGATEPESVATLPAELDEPLTLVLKYDPARVMYEASYRIGDGEWAWLGEGRTDPSRYAWYLRLSAAGSFADADEFVAIDHVRLSRHDPRRNTP